MRARVSVNGVVVATQHNLVSGTSGCIDYCITKAITGELPAGQAEIVITNRDNTFITPAVGVLEIDLVSVIP